MYPAPASDQFLNPDINGRVCATDHPSCSGIISATIESSRIQWCGEGHGALAPLPEAVRLRTATAQVWIAASRSATYEPDNEFHLCTDDVFLTFDTGTAARAGLRA